MAKCDLSVRTDEHERAVVCVGGDLDLVAAAPLRETLSDVIASGHREIVIDAIDVTFCDSVGLGVLLAAARQAGEHGQHMVIWRPRRALEDVLRFAGADQLLPIQAA
jgi:anti-sigma B factor antagonist